MPSIKGSRIAALSIVIAVAAVAGCARTEAADPKAPPPPAEVGVVTVAQKRVALTTELPGRTSAFLVAEVRPQVGGIVMKRNFTEGSDVKAGAVLYEIDPSSYEAALSQSKAALAKAKAALGNSKAGLVSAKAFHSRAKTENANAKAALARSEANAVPLRLKAQRLRELVAINAVSRQDSDDADAAVRLADAAIQGAEATVGGTEAAIEGAVALVTQAEAAIKVAEADIEGAEAAVEATRINLARTKVTAPISGRIGRSTVTTGALVTANQPTALSTIQQLSSIYVDVTQSSASLLRMTRNLESGRMKNDPGRATVKLLLEDGTPYPQAGSLKFSDVTVDPGTGSVTLRTVFPNPKGTLLPGMYVRAVVQEGVAEKAVVIPQRGVTRDPAGNATVMVVGPEEKVEPRTIKVSRVVGDGWLVDEGLSEGDRVIVEGLQKARPGSTVKAVPFVAASAGKK